LSAYLYIREGKLAQAREQLAVALSLQARNACAQRLLEALSTPRPDKVLLEIDRMFS
jgi:hypothetical protein